MEVALEWTAVVANVLYLILLIRRNIWCWPFGIAGSGLSIGLFVSTGLYSEAVLFGFYVLIGVYGWSQWSRNTVDDTHINPAVWNWKKHVMAVVSGAIIMLGLGWFFQTQTDAERAYADAFSTGYAFVASYLEAKRILSGWYYWIVLNAFSIWLYADRGLEIYAGLAVVYTGMSIFGLLSWQKKARALQTNS